VTGREPYGLNVVRFERDYPGWWLEVGTSGTGLRARPKGRRNGWIQAATLDELAALIDALEG
jgi:hypothetical protein